MGLTQSYDTEEIVNVSELTNADTKCVVKIVNKNKCLSKKAEIITIVIWDCEFIFNIERVSGNYRIAKHISVDVTMADLFMDMRKNYTYEKARKKMVNILSKILLKLRSIAREAETAGVSSRNIDLISAAGSILLCEITIHSIDDIVLQTRDEYPKYVDNFNKKLI